MKVPLFDIAAQNQVFGERLLASVRRVVESGRFILGREVARFEREAARFLGASYAVGCSSGSDALVLALQALGVGPGDEVVTTPFSFFASVESILRVGARPRFVDIHNDTFALDPNGLEAALTPRTRAILGVHLYGCPGAVEAWRAAADAAGLPLIEDAAQAFGARSAKRALGTFGQVGCFSFQPTKPLGAWGDAGLVVTDDAELAARLARLRTHGASSKHLHEEAGGNYRLDAVQAAVLAEKLDSLPNFLTARKERAEAYDAAFVGLAALSTPPRPAGADQSYALYTVRVTDGRRDALARFLAEHGIETAVHYPLPLHRQPALLALGLGLDWTALPNAERAAEQVLSLPLYPELSFDQLDHVARTVRQFFEAP
ncbi:MAG TPA: DegT/DnrJ/EryC1/StrS family aminotransferase [Polyangiaceae bacterium]|nr:DegT/DnrJ/EryC1/StrS family aminotransferase [Polyangiaceae bacterium]